MNVNTIIQGDTLEVLKQMPSESVNCVITSPPYWALRDYGIEGQLGLESTFEEYIKKLCDIFDEVKRVLKKDGTCWVNLGDTYRSNKSGDERKQITSMKRQKVNGLEKSLCMIPFRFAIEMVNRGWILRNTIIWHKPNCMPSSAKDRFTVDFEYVFFFSKSKRYWFEPQYEPFKESFLIDKRMNRTDLPINNIKNGYQEAKAQNPSEVRNRILEKAMQTQGRNKRCVWTITTKPFSGSHFAVFPEGLVEPMIKSGCQKDGIVLDIFAGSGTTCLVAKKLGRNYLGIELNPEYVKLANERVAGFKREDWKAKKAHKSLKEIL